MIKVLTFLTILFYSATLSGQKLDFYPVEKGELIKYTHFAVSYIEEHEQSEWVAYYLSRDMLKKVYERKNSFKGDPSVSTGTATYADYLSASNYDAGHLLPSRQMQFDCDAMSETFYMTNMSPQESQFNRYKWSYLEKLERNIAWRNDGVYVVTGPVLTRVNGTIGIENKISIPEYYYKVILEFDGANSKMLAFILPNRKEDTPLSDYVQSVDSVESLTGIDFFPILEDQTEEALESYSDKSKWSFTNSNSNYEYSAAAKNCSDSDANEEEGSTRVNINTATLDQLVSLPGIGPSKAQAIIDARPFTSVSDVVRAKGIGAATLNKLKELISVK